MIELIKAQKRRRHNQARIIKSPTQKTTDKGAGIFQQDPFLINLRLIIETHLADTDLRVSSICKYACVSRTKLHNKLVSLTGMSATAFIRSMRVEKARQLLVETDMNIISIAYETGFRSHSYFSRVFSKQVGMSPKEFRRRFKRK